MIQLRRNNAIRTFSGMAGVGIHGEAVTYYSEPDTLYCNGLPVRYGVKDEGEGLRPTLWLCAEEGCTECFEPFGIEPDELGRWWRKDLRI